MFLLHFSLKSKKRIKDQLASTRKLKISRLPVSTGFVMIPAKIQPLGQNYIGLQLGSVDTFSLFDKRQNSNHSFIPLFYFFLSETSPVRLRWEPELLSFMPLPWVKRILKSGKMKKTAWDWPKLTPDINQPTNYLLKYPWKDEKCIHCWATFSVKREEKKNQEKSQFSYFIKVTYQDDLNNMYSSLWKWKKKYILYWSFYMLPPFINSPLHP